MIAKLRWAKRIESLDGPVCLFFLLLFKINRRIRNTLAKSVENVQSVIVNSDRAMVCGLNRAVGNGSSWRRKMVGRGSATGLF
jgi:hypothetical protein